MPDPKKYSPSYERNIEPIIAKLNQLKFGQKRHVLEIGSGGGQHISRLADEFPETLFQPSEYDRNNLESINAWCEDKTNVKLAITLDATYPTWFDENLELFDALVCFNVIHASPWGVTTGIFAGAEKYMTQTCHLIFYGPFKVNGEQTSDSNAQFELWLQNKDPGFGVRDIEDVKLEAARHGFRLKASHDMPSNNFLQVFART